MFNHRITITLIFAPSKLNKSRSSCPLIVLEIERDANGQTTKIDKETNKKKKKDNGNIKKKKDNDNRDATREKELEIE